MIRVADWEVYELYPIQALDRLDVIKLRVKFWNGTVVEKNVCKLTSIQFSYFSLDNSALKIKLGGSIDKHTYRMHYICTGKYQAKLNEINRHRLLAIK